MKVAMTRSFLERTMRKRKNMWKKRRKKKRRERRKRNEKRRERLRKTVLKYRRHQQICDLV